MHTTQEDLIERLEGIVDATSVLDVLTALELMCLEKAEHLRCNWQDSAAALRYKRMAKILSTTAEKAQALDL